MCDNIVQYAKAKQHIDQLEKRLTQARRPKRVKHVPGQYEEPDSDEERNDGGEQAEDTPGPKKKLASPQMN